jgi:hypothetical protein
VPSKDDPDRAAGLLLKALGSLSERDRDLVLRTLLTGGIHPTPGREATHLRASGAPVSFPKIDVGMQIRRQMEQPLLVRLPTDLHVRLRSWATSHGFSMASVVRGLVERFLDEQDGQSTAGRRTPPG